jgi:hypothetical protein
MPIFENLSSLLHYVGTVTIDEMAIEVQRGNEEELLSQLRDNVYNTPSDGQYERTFGLLDAVTTNTVFIGGGKDRTIELETYIEPSQLPHDYESMYTGNADNREHIVNWLENGHGGYYMNRAISYKPRKFLSKSRKKINNETKKRIIKRLKAKGYKFGYLTDLSDDI